MNEPRRLVEVKGEGLKPCSRCNELALPRYAVEGHSGRYCPDCMVKVILTDWKLIK
jgi:hypothetical protein